MFRQTMRYVFCSFFVRFFYVRKNYPFVFFFCFVKLRELKKFTGVNLLLRIVFSTFVGAFVRLLSLFPYHFIRIRDPNSARYLC